MSVFAPVLIPTLNRDIHLKQCIDSLLSCDGVEQTDLIVALDYPSKDIHWDGYNKIKSYLDSVKGFASVRIIKRDHNFGAMPNFFSLMKEAFSEFDRVIYLEDDCVVGKGFLRFVNKGLSTYQERQDIFSISGYQNPFDMPKWYNDDVYLRRGFVVYGVGLWNHKWQKIDWSIETYRKMFFAKKLNKQLSTNFLLYYDQLKKICDTNHITADGYILVYLLFNELYSVYPSLTRVRNTGFDNSGAHCKESSLYANQVVYNGYEHDNMPLDIAFNTRLDRYILKQIKVKKTWKQKVKLLIPNKLLHILKRK